MSKNIIQAPNAPKALGPYNHIVQAGGFFFFSGQVPLDPQTGELVQGGIEEQTGRVLENIGILLQSIGKDFQDVVKTTIYMIDLQQFGKVNEIYAQTFQKEHPARATVQVAALPKGALIEIEVIVAE